MCKPVKTNIAKRLHQCSRQKTCAARQLNHLLGADLGPFMSKNRASNEFARTDSAYMPPPPKWPTSARIRSKKKGSKGSSGAMRPFMCCAPSHSWANHAWPCQGPKLSEWVMPTVVVTKESPHTEIASWISFHTRWKGSLFTQSNNCFPNSK